MRRILLLSVFLIGPFILKGQTDDLKNKIDSLLGAQVMAATPGGAVAVVKDGKILYKKMFGLANLDYRIPVTDSTVFNLCSVSKQFTAFLVLLLEKEGKLNLDDSLRKYVPELNTYGYTITIRQLLHHTSGIPTGDVLRLFAGQSEGTPWNNEDEFNLLQSYHKLNFKPNEELLYSNDGYFLLSRIVEKVMDKPFSECIGEKIFAPLNMKTASIYDTPGKVIPNRAKGYRLKGTDFSETFTESESVCGYSNIYASINDMIKWSINLISKSVGGEQVINRLCDLRDTLNNGDTIKYTYGFFVKQNKGLKQVYHEGGDIGFRAYLSYFPETGLSVIVLANGETADHLKIAGDIADLCLKDLMKPEIYKEHKEMSVNKELYHLYKGSYLLSDGNVLSFDNVNDTIKLIIPDGPKFVLYPEKENAFFLKDFDAQCTFIINDKEKVDEIIWHQNNMDFNGARYTEPKPLTDKELQSYSGIYDIVGLDIAYSVYAKDNDLILALPENFKKFNIDPNIKLTHRSGDVFYGILEKIYFKRNKEGQVTGFVIADVGRVRNIEFTKRD